MLPRISPQAFLTALLVVGRLGWAQTTTTASVTIDARGDGVAIPAAVYGINNIFLPGTTVSRHGGNRLTGFNWENNASNAGSDYLQSSDSFLGSGVGIGNSQTPGAVLQAWMNEDRSHGQKTIMTLPIAGYVAADMNGVVSEAETAPSPRWRQVVVNKPTALSLAPNQNDGVVYLDEMVNFLLQKYGTAAQTGVAAYCLDNEPALWPYTHPRIHPVAVTYQELATRNADAAKMATALDPSAQIYGPVLYGWTPFLNLQNATDSATFNEAYGTFANYYLARMKSASDVAGRRLLNRFDMHWYPEARGDHRIVFDTTSPSYGTSNDINARLQAPRSLWDASYIENSYIPSSVGGESVRLLTRIQGGIDQYFPGTDKAITEYNYGGTEHISGGVAQADVLGIFCDYQVAACFWPLIDDNSYVAAAFKLYRNYNGTGGTYGSRALPAAASRNDRVGVHAARFTTGSNKLTVVAINRSQTRILNAQIQFTLPVGQALGNVKIYRLSAAGGANIIASTTSPTLAVSNFPDSLPAMSAALYEVQLLSGFSAWQRSQFGGNASNANLAGATVDPDRDGVANLLEYATVRNPNLADATPLLTAKCIPNAAGTQVELQFQKRKNLADVSLLLQTTTSLTDNSWITVDTAANNPTITSLNTDTELWTFILPATTGQFYRLKAQF